MKRSLKILEAVAVKHKLIVADIVSKHRFPRLVAARREAILEMKAIGMSSSVIARAIRRERTTILEYTDPDRAAYKKQYHATHWRRWRDEREERERMAQIPDVIIDRSPEQKRIYAIKLRAALGAV